jgi:threonine dehydratase
MNSTANPDLENLDLLFDGVQAAAARLDGTANKTPVVTSRMLNASIGAQIYFKCENFQRMGAFKFRGAFNAMSRLTGEERRRGVITHSSGNHAQAVALVGSLLGIQTHIVMPDNAPAIKRAATEGYGGNVIEYDPEADTREEISDRLQRKHQYVSIPPFNHLDVVSGQATAALELIREVGELDLLLVPCGGGGLLSGSAISCKKLSPHCRVVGVEPQLADDAARSFRTGKLHTVKNPPTIADGTRTPSLGAITFPLVLRYVDDMLTVSEEAIVDAVRHCFYRQKMVVEPSGALGLAAIRSGAAPSKGRIGVILSGGNMDGSTMAKILNG